MKISELVSILDTFFDQEDEIRVTVDNVKCKEIKSITKVRKINVEPDEIKEDSFVVIS